MSTKPDIPHRYKQYNTGSEASTLKLEILKTENNFYLYCCYCIWFPGSRDIETEKISRAYARLQKER